ncbi:MAG: Flp family type IVb pilin [Devosia sp.]|jgi:pilus assembly protein Flp/PilA|nr:Flp family type IVb pilin [Devosia sp.]
MKELSAGLRRFVDDQAGATAIEYGLIAALVAVGAILAMTVFGGNLSGMFNTVSTRAGDAMANAGT